MKCGVVSFPFEGRGQNGALGIDSEKVEFMISDHKPSFPVRSVRSIVYSIFDLSNHQWPIGRRVTFPTAQEPPTTPRAGIPLPAATGQAPVAIPRTHA